MGRGTPTKTKRNANVFRYYQLGYTQSKIGRIFHISQPGVSNIIKRERKNVAQDFQG